MSPQRHGKAWQKIVMILAADISKMLAGFVAIFVGRTSLKKKKAYADSHYALLQRARIVATFFAFMGLFIWFRMIYIVVVINLENGAILNAIENSRGSIFVQSVGTSTLFIIGYLLFYLKKSRQFFYGIIEASFALASGFEFIDSFLNSLLIGNMSINYLLPFMSVIYLVVRGLTNMSEGFGKLDQVFIKSIYAEDEQVTDPVFEDINVNSIEMQFQEDK